MRTLFTALLFFTGIFTILADYPKPQQALNGKYGYYNSNGVAEIRPRFDNALNFHDNFAAVEIHGKWGFINLQGRMITKCKYQEVRDFNYGYAAVCENGLWGVIDTTGKEVVPCIFKEIGDLVDMKSVVERYTPVIGQEALELNN